MCRSSSALNPTEIGLREQLYIIPSMNERSPCTTYSLADGRRWSSGDCLRLLADCWLHSIPRLQADLGLDRINRVEERMAFGPSCRLDKESSQQAGRQQTETDRHG